MRIFQLQRWTAIALLVFMTIHIVVVHYPPGHLDFSRVIERLDQPLWKAIDIAFLLTVLIHALTGIYMVLTDHGKVYVYRRGLLGTVAVIGVLAFIYGTVTILAFNP